MRNPKHLILYRAFYHEKLFHDFVWMMERYHNNCYHESFTIKHQNAYNDVEDVLALLYECIGQLVELSADYGFEGNLWHSFLAFLLVNHENPYSRACEISGSAEGSLDRIALHDFEIIKDLFHFDFQAFAEYLDVDCMDAVLNYEGTGTNGKILHKRVRDRIHKLKLKLASAVDAAAFKEAVTEFYQEFGVGKLGLHKAFRVERREGGLAEIVPITNIANVHLDDLIGYEAAKQKLIENTEAFLNGRPANNCLLFGDAGTGKSTSIKAIANQYYDRGLRLIEIYKHQFCYLNDVITQIKNRNYKCIIYMDDLSFEEFETEYKYLKAVIEGGLEKKPENILIYATSNRRHLIRENYSDKEKIQQDMHTSDTVQEKLSLYARFGVSVYFGAPSKKEFQTIVKELAKRYHVSVQEEELLLEANKWEMSHGGLSGRTAQQFMNYLLGKECEGSDEF